MKVETDAGSFFLCDKTCCETEVLGRGGAAKNYEGDASHIWRTVWDVTSEALFLHCLSPRIPENWWQCWLLVLDVNVSRYDYGSCLQCGFGCWFSWQTPKPLSDTKAWTVKLYITYGILVTNMTSWYPKMFLLVILKYFHFEVMGIEFFLERMNYHHLRGGCDLRV